MNSGQKIVIAFSPAFTRASNHFVIQLENLELI